MKKNEKPQVSISAPKPLPIAGRVEKPAQSRSIPWLERVKNVVIEVKGKGKGKRVLAGTPKSSGQVENWYELKVGTCECPAYRVQGMRPCKHLQAAVSRGVKLSG